MYVDGSHRGLDVLVDGAFSWQLLETGGVLVFDDYFWACLGDDPLLRPGPAIDALVGLLGVHAETLLRDRQVAMRKLSWLLPLGWASVMALSEHRESLEQHEAASPGGDQAGTSPAELDAAHRQPTSRRAASGTLRGRSRSSRSVCSRRTRVTGVEREIAPAHRPRRRDPAHAQLAWTAPCALRSTRAPVLRSVADDATVLRRSRRGQRVHERAPRGRRARGRGARHATEVVSTRFPRTARRLRRRSRTSTSSASRGAAPDARAARAHDRVLHRAAGDVLVRPERVARAARGRRRGHLRRRGPRARTPGCARRALPSRLHGLLGLVER